MSSKHVIFELMAQHTLSLQLIYTHVALSCVLHFHILNVQGLVREANSCKQ